MSATSRHRLALDHMIVLKAFATDDVNTGWRYSITVDEQQPIVTADVVEAVKILEALGAEKPEDLVDIARKRGRIEIRKRSA